MQAQTQPQAQETASKCVLVVTAVEAEREAIVRGLGADKRFHVVAGGVGPAVAAAAAASRLAGADYAAVICAGIAGGFPGIAAIGDLVVADAIIAADLGVQTPEGFRSVDELGFGSARASVDPGLAARTLEALRQAGLSAVSGPVLTVSTTTGTGPTADELAARVPGAAAEAMEGYGVAVAAQLHGLPMLEVRAVSNVVGPRDRSSWRIGEALAKLERAGAILKEVL